MESSANCHVLELKVDLSLRFTAILSPRQRSTTAFRSCIACGYVHRLHSFAGARRLLWIRPARLVYIISCKAMTFSLTAYYRISVSCLFPSSLFLPVLWHHFNDQGFSWAELSIDILYADTYSLAIFGISASQHSLCQVSSREVQERLGSHLVCGGAAAPPSGW